MFRVARVPKSTYLTLLITDTQFTFLVPGYLSPLRLNGTPEAAADNTCPEPIQWRVVEEQIPWQAGLARVLGDLECNGLHLPAAEILSIDSAGKRADIRIDPVHLRADRDTAKLYPRQMLDLRPDEEVELLETLNQFLSDDKLQILPGADQGWYLYGNDASRLASLPPSFLANRNASAYMPTGEGTEHWQRLMAEIQMLIHHHPVNERRAADGRLSINSLWLWGSGNLQHSLPKITEHDETSQPVVFGNDDYTESVCQYLGLSYRHFDAFDPDAVGHTIVVDTRIAQAVFSNDESLAQQLVRDIDRNWLLPVCARQRKDQKLQLSIMNEDGDIGELDADAQVSLEGSGGRFKQWLRHLGSGFRPG